MKKEKVFGGNVKVIESPSSYEPNSKHSVYYNRDGEIAEEKDAYALEEKIKDRTFYYIKFYEDGTFCGQPFNPSKTIGYVKNLSIKRVEKDTFDQYVLFLKTKKSRYLEGAIVNYGKEKAR